MSDLDVTLRPLGDAGVLVELREEISPEVGRQCLALRDEISRAWQREGPGRLLDLVPAYRSLAVYFDPDHTDPTDARTFLERVARGFRPPPDHGPQHKARWRVPVVYGGEEGPDLPQVAQSLGLSESEVVRLHGEALYRLYMYGFAPGHASLAESPPPLRIGRRSEPRAAVEQGAIGLGGRQCGIYSLRGPGGLHIIGRTAIRLFFADRVPPTPMAVGDQVQFVAVEMMADAGCLERTQ